MKVTILSKKYGRVPWAALLTGVLLGSCLMLRAQEPKAGVQEPQYIGEFFLLGADGTLTPLERERVMIENKAHNHFFSVSATGEAVVPGVSSPVRIPAGSHFVVKVTPESNSVDPGNLYSMMPFLVQKGQRAILLTTAKAGAFQGAKSETAADTSIALNFKKYGESSLEIVPAQPLPPGEYAIGVHRSLTLFCFGVDAK